MPTPLLASRDGDHVDANEGDDDEEEEDVGPEGGGISVLASLPPACSRSPLR